MDQNFAEFIAPARHTPNIDKCPRIKDKTQGTSPIAKVLTGSCYRSDINQCRQPVMRSIAAFE